MEEIWKDIKDYEGLYQVSNLGNIKSLSRKRGNQFDYQDIILKQGNWRGYKNVILQKDGKVKCYMVHRLVAQAFIPNDDPEYKTQVNHISEVKTENTVSNLEWCTPKYNMNYGTCLERGAEKRRNLKHLSKQVCQYDLEGNLIKIWPSLREIERVLGFNHTRISFVCNKRKWCKSAFGFKWEYAENNREIA